MAKDNQLLGRKGQKLAAEFLKKNGYRLISLNYRTNFGELDIIARDKNVICFIEVKARSSSAFGFPEESIVKVKQLHIARAALQFLKDKKIKNVKSRFDVVAVDFDSKDNQVKLIKDAFELPEDLD